MLALSDRSYLEARRSPAIDVYALCSVLYEVYCGHTPYQLADHQGESAFDLKVAGLPPAPALHDPRDKGLVEAIMSGLAPAQEDRPSAADLFATLAAWRKTVTGQTTSKPGPARRKFARGVARLTIAKAPASDAVPQSGDSAQGLASATEEGKSMRGTRGRSLSRRGLIVGAACVAAAAGGIYWWQRSTPAGKARQFAGMGWEDLADLADRLSAAGTRDEALSLAVEAGIAHEDGSMADNLIHKVTLGDGTEASVQVVDFCHDDRADGQGKAGLTFAFTEPVAERPMADQAMASGGWEQCDLRAWLDTDFRSLLPDELASRLVPVLKMTNNAGSTRDASSVTATEDSLWLFSMKEMGGAFLQSNFGADYQYLEPILNAEGEQYRLWQDQRTAPKGENSCLQRSWQGQPCLWWNRSPSPDCSEDNGETWFNRVGTNGDVFRFACAATGDDNVSTVLPGFCL